MPFEVGLFDMETQETVNMSTYCTDRQYIFKYKSPSKGFRTKAGDERNAELPLMSLPLGRVDQTHAFTDVVKEPKPFIGYLGWDSVSACKSLNLECGKTYHLMIKANGKNLRDTFGRDFEEFISFSTKCCDACSLGESAKSVVETIMDAINEQSFYLKDNFMKIEPVYDCCPNEPFEKIEYRKYCISLCDTGDSHALASIQAQYPDLDITRTKREGVISTYEVCKRCELTTPDDPATPDVDETVWTCEAPADYTTSGTTMVICDECPTGYTLVPGGYKYVVEMAYDGLNEDYLAVVQAVYASATSANLLACTAGIGTFEVVFPESFDGTMVANTKIRKVGPTPGMCTEDDAQTFSWTECGEAYRIKRTLCITLPNDECNNQDRLAELTEYYKDTKDMVADTLVVKTLGNCNTVYEVQQENNDCLMDGCDTYGKDGAKFDRFPEFDGHIWEACECEGWTFDSDGCPVAPTDPELLDCRAGIKFTGMFIDLNTGECRVQPYDQIMVDPVRIEVSLVDPDLGTECEVNTIPWTIIQEPTIQQGLGMYVYRDIIHSRGYDNYIYTNPDAEYGQLWNDVLGYDYGVQVSRYYHHFDLYHYSNRVRHAVQTDHKTREVIRFYIDSEDLILQEQVKTLLNRTLLAQGGCNLL